MFSSHANCTSSYLMLTCGLFLFTGHAAAEWGEPYVIKDVTSTLESLPPSKPQNFCQVGNTTYFSAVNLPAGRELWRTDGTPQGTVLVKDINPVDDSHPRELIDVDGTLYFAATTNLGSELWKSDGTAGGTVMVKDLDPGAGNGLYPNAELTAFNGNLYFIGTPVFFSSPYMPDRPTRYLYKTDGTPDGTIFFENAEADPIDYIEELEVSGDKLFVSNNLSLWMTDGTGNTLVELLPFEEMGHSRAKDLTNVNGTLFFTLQEAADSDENQGRELWKSDGTAPGTVKVTDLGPGTGAGVYMSQLTAFNDKIYFAGGSDAAGVELWESDGTAAGTVLVKDINSGSDSGLGFSSFPNSLTVVGNQLWFAADQTVDSFTQDESELDLFRDPWVSDGTAAGTHLAADLEDVGGGFASDIRVDPTGFTSLEGTTYFIGQYEAEPDPDDPFPITKVITTIYKSDGTPVGTLPVAPDFDFDVGLSIGSMELFSRPDMLLAGGERITDWWGEELYHSDGTDAGTTLLKDINAYPFSANPNRGVMFNGFFCSTQYQPAIPGPFARSERKIVVSDGTPGAAIMYDTPGDVIEILGVANNHLFYYSEEEVNIFDSIFRLVATNGTPAGEVVLVESEDEIPINDFASWGDRALFVMQNENTGFNELWVTDGTAAGTNIIYAGKEDYEIENLTIIDASAAIFYQTTGWRDHEVWRTDGTAVGTALVKGIAGGEDDSISDFAVLGGKALFFTSLDYGGSAPDAGGNFYLTETDGTDEGTKTIISNAIFNETSDVTILGAAGDKLYFTHDANLYSEDIGQELWAYDQSETSISLVKDIWPGSESAITFAGQTNGAAAFFGHQDFFFFRANDGTHGAELWRTDGTAAGTMMVEDIAPGFASSLPGLFASAGESLLFAANDPHAGYELYILDTPEGAPRLLQDINPGPSPSIPRDFVSAPDLNLVFFSADNSATGRELWALPTEGWVGPTGAKMWELYE